MEKFVRKHYRVAQKEAECAPRNPARIEKIKKYHKKAGIAILVFLVFCWVEGFVIGYLIGKRNGR